MKKSKNSRDGARISQIFFNVISILGGVFMGIFSMINLESVFGEDEFLITYVVLILIVIITFVLQSIIHELGHLVAGLISGYSFSSFRVGGLMLIKENGTFHLRIHSLAGTGGQCLMIPPERDENGNYPIILYNLGGVIFNCLSLPLFGAVAALIHGEDTVWFVFFSMLVFTGALNAVVNGIPMRLSAVNNDGSNIVELRDSAEARRVFYNQFRMIDYMGRGTRLRDMPSDIFYMPDDSSLDNSISVGGAVFYENRLIDEGKYREAAELIDHILSIDTALIGVHRALLIGDRITVALLLGEERELAERLLADKKFTEISKQMKNSITFIRVEYARLRLLECNDAKAEGLRKKFDKYAASHPYFADVAPETDLMLAIDAAAETANAATDLGDDNK